MLQNRYQLLVRRHACAHDLAAGRYHTHCRHTDRVSVHRLPGSSVASAGFSAFSRFSPTVFLPIPHRNFLARTAVAVIVYAIHFFFFFRHVAVRRARNKFRFDFPSAPDTRTDRPPIPPLLSVNPRREAHSATATNASSRFNYRFTQPLPLTVDMNSNMSSWDLSGALFQSLFPGKQ